MNKGHYKILDEIVSEFPDKDFQFCIKKLIKDIPQEEYFRLMRYKLNRFHTGKFRWKRLVHSCLRGDGEYSIIENFLSKNAFIIDAKIDTPSYRYDRKAEEHYVELTDKGQRLKNAGSYKKFNRKEKYFKNPHLIEWKKFWLGYLVGFVSSLISALLMYYFMGSCNR